MCKCENTQIDMSTASNPLSVFSYVQCTVNVNVNVHTYTLSSNMHTEYEINGNERIHTQPIRYASDMKLVSFLMFNNNWFVWWCWCWCANLSISCVKHIRVGTFEVFEKLREKLSNLNTIPTGRQQPVDMLCGTCNNLNFYHLIMDAFSHFRF